MINRIGLKNWRAYESAQIPFEQGTTFIVAPNGIGKTSLLRALLGLDEARAGTISWGNEEIGAHGVGP